MVENYCCGEQKSGRVKNKEEKMVDNSICDDAVLKHQEKKSVTEQYDCRFINENCIHPFKDSLCLIRGFYKKKSLQARSLKDICFEAEKDLIMKTCTVAESLGYSVTQAYALHREAFRLWEKHFGSDLHLSDEDRLYELQSTHMYVVDKIHEELDLKTNNCALKDNGGRK
jgi:hypothetical protein